MHASSNLLLYCYRYLILDKKGNAQVVEEKPVKHVRMEQSTPNTVTNNGTQIPTKTEDGGGNDDPKRRVVTMEPSVHTFAGNSSARRDRSDPVMITDALSDVRVK